MNRPLAITMGDPAGIAPEIVIKAFATRHRTGRAWLYLGSPDVLTWASERLELPIRLQRVRTVAEALRLPETVLPVLPTKAPVRREGLAFGVPDPQHAPAIIESIERSCRLALAGEVAAVVTPPINKATLHAAGFMVPGHTEILAQCAGAYRPVMMLVGRGLRVVPATIHQSLASVPGSLNQQMLTEILEIVFQSLQRDFGIPDPLIAVAGLNPHAGEQGAFGREDEEIIAPVCLALQSLGRQVRGPLPADTLFHAAARATFDAVVCMYHDQALIPIKMLAFGEAVNITLGLPIIRTSVDHGTAYGIAGQGIADCSSLLAAAVLAEEIVTNRER